VITKSGHMTGDLELSARGPTPHPKTGGRVELRGISQRYGKNWVLQPLDLSIEGGEFLTILGPSGSGKTTILRIIGGFVEPTQGKLLLDGSEITGLAVTKRPFNTVFQDYALFPYMTVEQNVGYGLMVRGMARREIAQRVSEVLEVVGLDDRATFLPRQLSGGQKQRVALARAIICEPRVILLDEPLSALDAELRRQMQIFLKRLQKKILTTFVFVTHDQEEAITMSDRIVIMNKGKIEQLGRPRELYYRPATEFVASFFGDNNVFDGTVESQKKGTLRLHTPLGTVFSACPEKNSNTKMRVTLRPEQVQLVPASKTITGDDMMGFGTGVLQSLDFVGALTHAQIRLADGELLKAKLPTPSLSPSLSVGDEIGFKWRQSEIHLVAVDGSERKRFNFTVER
jgi:spermidine/putrescine transport system ATP-binding protein